jgi:SAM-dependent methyltransferase
VRICAHCGSRLGDAGWTCAACGWVARVRDGFPEVSGGAAEDGFPVESFDLLPEAEEASFWFRGRNRLIEWALDRYAPRAGSFLEVGCGTGFVLAGLYRKRPHLRLVGGEPHHAGLATARERVPAAELLLLDGRRMPFREEFDAAGAFDVLEHVDEDDAVAGQLHAALRPGGVLLVTVPQHPRLWSPIDEFSQHRRRYRRRGLVLLLETAGFEVVRTSSFVSFALPLVALSRLRERRTNEPFDPLREYRIPPPVEWALAASLALELRAIRAGIGLPAGSSLLAVARRR